MGGRIPDDGNYAEESKEFPPSDIHQKISISKVFLVYGLSKVCFCFSDFRWYVFSKKGIFKVRQIRIAEFIIKMVATRR